MKRLLVGNGDDGRSRSTLTAICHRMDAETAAEERLPLMSVLQQRPNKGCLNPDNQSKFCHNVRSTATSHQLI